MNCPICGHVLYKKYEGLCCRNNNCELYYKLGKGWIFRDGTSPYEENQKFFLERVYKMTRDDNRAKWLMLKKEILLRDNFTCQSCKNSPIEKYSFNQQLEVHHILSRQENPELSFDRDNLITLCEGCHKEAHSKDKRHFK